ncbi:MAG: GTP-binding protein [Alphaproteobacteria bacterium]|nr:GTP-binding protein [Alphaproteobacteria bacterium]
MRHFSSPDIGMFGRRQRHARAHRVAVTIARPGAASPESDVAVVADTFGAGDVAPFGPCRCCTVRVALQATLRQLLAERERRRFNRVAIESAEDLGPILRTFAPERALGSAFYVEAHPSIVAPDAPGICRFDLVEEAPLRWDAFSRFVTTLTALRGADLLQVKGRLNVAACRGPVVVELLGHLAHQPVELQAWPGDDRTSRLAFVTRGIVEKSVRDLLGAVRALS